MSIPEVLSSLVLIEKLQTSFHDHDQIMVVSESVIVSRQLQNQQNQNYTVAATQAATTAGTLKTVSIVLHKQFCENLTIVVVRIVVMSSACTKKVRC